MSASDILKRRSPGRLLPSLEVLKGLRLDRLVADGDDCAPIDHLSRLGLLVVSMIFLAMAMIMLPSDSALIIVSRTHQFLVFHYVFRTLVATAMVGLGIRASGRKTRVADFYLFAAIGFAYAVEGTVFNPSYFLAFLQVCGALAWFSTLDILPLGIVLATASGVYSLALLRFGIPQDARACAVSDYVAGVWLTSVSMLMCGTMRAHWQQRNAELVAKQVDAENKLSLLGRHLGQVFHDLSNGLAVISGHLHLLQMNPDLDGEIKHSLGRMDLATTSLIQLRDFVLAMVSGKESGIRQQVSSAELNQLLKSILCTLCPEATGHLTIDVEPERRFYIATTGVTYAILNAVTNSVKTHHQFRSKGNADSDQFAIHVAVNATPQGTYIEVRDNGPGFPDHVLERLFKQPITTRGPGSHGLGVDNIRRYIECQGGSVRVYNDGGAVVALTIPLGAN